MKRFALLVAISMLSFVTLGAAQFRPKYTPPKPVYHAPTTKPVPPARGPRPTHTDSPRPVDRRPATPINNRGNRNVRPQRPDRTNDYAKRNQQREQQREAKRQDKGRRDADKARNKERKNRNKVRRNEYRGARKAFHNGRFNDRYFGEHFGFGHPIIWGGPGFWYGSPFMGPFFFGGIYWSWGYDFMFLPEWQIGGWYIDYMPGGYMLVNPGFPTITIPVIVNIDLAPVDDGAAEGQASE